MTATPRDAAHRTDVVVAMVRDNDASHQVWLTERTGAIHGLNIGHRAAIGPHVYS